MEESDSLNTSNNSILSIGIEGSPETDLHINVLAAKDEDFSSKKSLRKRHSRCLTSPDDALRSAMNQMQSNRPEYIHPKQDDMILNDIPSQEQTDSPNIQKKKTYAQWKTLTLVAQSIQRLRSLSVEKIKSATILHENVLASNWKPKPIKNEIMYVTADHMQTDALNNFRDHSTFFRALERGSFDDLKYIKSALSHDPKANLYDVDSVERLVNKPNHKGYTPLYVACKNGNLTLLKLLIEFQSNPLQLCQVSSKVKESILLVSARWGHQDLICYLLNLNVRWPRKELKKAYEEAQSVKLKDFLKTEIRTVKK